MTSAFATSEVASVFEGKFGGIMRTIFCFQKHNTESEMAAKQSDGINDGVSDSGRQHRGSNGDG